MNENTTKEEDEDEITLPKGKSIYFHPTNLGSRKLLPIILTGLIVFFVCEISFIIYKYKTKQVLIPIITYNVPTITIIKPPDIIVAPTNSVLLPNAITLPSSIPTCKPPVKIIGKDYGI